MGVVFGAGAVSGEGAPSGDALAPDDAVAAGDAVSSWAVVPQVDAVAARAQGAPNAVGTEPVFREPWEAQAFAMTVLLHERGLFTWGEWAQALGAQIASADAASARSAAVTGAASATSKADIAASEREPAADRSYYQHWLAALESLVAAKGASSVTELTRYQRAWEHAAHRTPHGQSIDLQPQDLGA